MGRILSSSGDTGELKSRTSMSMSSGRWTSCGDGFQTGDWGYLHIYTFVSTKTPQNFWRSICSRARISRSLAVTVVRCALTTDNLREKRGLKQRLDELELIGVTFSQRQRLASRLNNSSRSCCRS